MKSDQMSATEGEALASRSASPTGDNRSDSNMKKDKIGLINRIWALLIQCFLLLVSTFNYSPTGQYSYIEVSDMNSGCDLELELDDLDDQREGGLLDDFDNLDLSVIDEKGRTKAHSSHDLYEAKPHNGKPPGSYQVPSSNAVF